MPTSSDRKASGSDELAAEVPALKPALVYVGNGAALPDVPARDLAVDEMDDLASTVGPQITGNKGRASLIKALVESGLYQE